MLIECAAQLCSNELGCNLPCAKRSLFGLWCVSAFSAHSTVYHLINCEFTYRNAEASHFAWPFGLSYYDWHCCEIRDGSFAGERETMVMIDMEHRNVLLFVVLHRIAYPKLWTIVCFTCYSASLPILTPKIPHSQTRRANEYEIIFDGCRCGNARIQLKCRLNREQHGRRCVPHIYHSSIRNLQCARVMCVRVEYANWLDLFFRRHTPLTSKTV